MPQSGAPELDRLPASTASPASTARRPRGATAETSTPGLEAPVWARYRDNVARHLIGIARDLQLRLMSQLADRGHEELRPSFGLLITLVARSPRPLSQLARALAISPQATSQLVALAERGGYLTRRSDPQDRRASWPILTSAGERLVADAVAALQGFEIDHAKRVGETEARRFREALAILASSPDRTERADRTDGTDRLHRSGRATLAAAGPIRASIGLLPILAARLEQDLMRATALRGHAGLKLSHGQILTLVGPAGVRLHRLAELHGVSRQAISAIAQDLEALGHLRREADPVDRRGVVVRLTERGARLIEDSVSALDALERDWQQRLDPASYAVFTDVARRLYAALELEGSILSDAFDASRPATIGAAPRAEFLPRSIAAARSAADFATDIAARTTADALTIAPDGDDLARLAEHLRLRLGARDAARLAEHLTAGAGPPPTPIPTSTTARGPG